MIRAMVRANQRIGAKAEEMGARHRRVPWGCGAALGITAQAMDRSVFPRGSGLVAAPCRWAA